MSGAGPSNPDKGRKAAASTSAAGSSDWAEEMNSISDAGPSRTDKGKGKEVSTSAAGPSRSDNGKGKGREASTSAAGPSRGTKRTASPSNGSVSGVDEEIVSQGAKRHRSGGHGFGPRNPRPRGPGPRGPGPRGLELAPAAARVPHGIMVPLQQAGNDGYLTGGGLRQDANGALMPLNADPANLPTQWAEQIPSLMGGLAGQADRRMGGANFVRRAAQDVLDMSRSGQIHFFLTPVRDYTRYHGLPSEAEVRRALDRLPTTGAERRAMEQRARQIAAQEDRRAEVEAARQETLGNAVALVFRPLKETEVNDEACEYCDKLTHKTGHCPVASRNHDTPVDSFCNTSFSGHHTLDADVRFDDDGRIVGCATMVNHQENGRLTELFIHLVVYRIHKPPLRVRNSLFCWVKVLIRYVDRVCRGEMPREIVDNGGLFPYTKNDVATYKEQLKDFDAIGASKMPRGELDGKNITEIKSMVVQRKLRSQVYRTRGKPHSEEVRNVLFADGLDLDMGPPDGGKDHDGDQNMQADGPKEGGVVGADGDLIMQGDQPSAEDDLNEILEAAAKVPLPPEPNEGELDGSIDWSGSEREDSLLPTAKGSKKGASDTYRQLSTSPTPSDKVRRPAAASRLLENMDAMLPRRPKTGRN